jgi:hypothetical protein
MSEPVKGLGAGRSTYSGRSIEPGTERLGERRPGVNGDRMTVLTLWSVRAQYIGVEFSTMHNVATRRKGTRP